MTYTNICWDDEVTSWTTSASDIAYTLLHTWTSGSSNSEVDSTASVPVWSNSASSNQCVRSFNLQVEQDDGSWFEINKADTSYYVGGCTDSDSGALDSQGSP